MSARKVHPSKRQLRSPKATGAMVLLFLLVFSLFAFNRPRVETTLASGEGMKAEFSQAYKLVPFQSVVKVAGVEVGTVTGYERTDANHAVVEMKLDDGTREKLGTAPSANVRPTLVLGGTYYVELVRGGKDGSVAEDSTIPIDRTSVPVELDKVLSTITPDAAEAVRGTVQSLDRTFGKKGRAEARRFLSEAPGTLNPATDVLAGLRGTEPDRDLTNLVTGLRNTSAALTRQEGQFGDILDDLDTFSATLADERAPLARAVSEGPETLLVTRNGLADLNGTLARLTTTADSFRPAARALDPVLVELDRVLKTARPVIANARVVARDARPLVQDLVPTSQNATDILNDFAGPVLGRLDGPVKDAVLSPWHGRGVYEGGGNDHRLYEEVGYLLSDTADVFKFHDHNGAMGRLMAGVGLSTPGGIIGKSLVEYLEMLGLQLPPGPDEGANEGEQPPPLGSSPSSASPATSNPGVSTLLDLLSLPPSLFSRSAR